MIDGNKSKETQIKKFMVYVCETVWLKFPE